MLHINISYRDGILEERWEWHRCRDKRGTHHIRNARSSSSHTGKLGLWHRALCTNRGGRLWQISSIGNKDKGAPPQQCGCCFILGKYENITIKPTILFINPSNKYRASKKTNPSNLTPISWDCITYLVLPTILEIRKHFNYKRLGIILFSLFNKILFLSALYITFYHHNFVTFGGKFWYHLTYRPEP